MKIHSGVKVLMIMVVMLLGVGPALAAVTPEAVRAWWNPYAAMAMVAFGMVVKFWPPLAKLHNEAIGWLNTVLYIVASLVMPGIVHAGAGAVVGGAALTFADTVVRGVVHSASAMVLWETLGRYAIQRVLGMRPAVAGK